MDVGVFLEGQGLVHEADRPLNSIYCWDE